MCCELLCGTKCTGSDRSTREAFCVCSVLKVILTALPFANSEKGLAQTQLELRLGSHPEHPACCSRLCWEGQPCTLKSTPERMGSQYSDHPAQPGTPKGRAVSTVTTLHSQVPPKDGQLVPQWQPPWGQGSVPPALLPPVLC